MKNKFSPKEVLPARVEAGQDINVTATAMPGGLRPPGTRAMIRAGRSVMLSLGRPGGGTVSVSAFINGRGGQPAQPAGTLARGLR